MRHLKIMFLIYYTDQCFHRHTVETIAFRCVHAARLLSEQEHRCVSRDYDYYIGKTATQCADIATSNFW